MPMTDHPDLRDPGPSFSFADVVANANDVVIVTAAYSGSIVYVNPAFTKLTLYRLDDAMGKSPGKLLQGPETDQGTVREIREALRQCRGIRTEILNYDRSGRAYWLDINIVPLRDARGEVNHFAAIERDVTAYRKDRQDLLLLAATDPLTGLANRRAFTDTLRREIERTRRTQSPLSLIAFDLDHFKLANDTHGHAGGDCILQAVATRCTSVLRPHDTLARTGGEEFHILLPDTSPDRAVQVAERVRRALCSRPVTLERKVQTVTASFGVTAVADLFDEGRTSLVRADQLMYLAKTSGRNRVCGDEPEVLDLRQGRPYEASSHPPLATAGMTCPLPAIPN